MPAPFNPAMPMPPEGMGALPPGPGAEATDQELIDLANAVDDTKADVMAKAAPEPTTPYKVKTLRYLADVLGRLAKAIPGAPAVTWKQEEGRPDWPMPLPPDLWLPFLALSEAAKALNGDGRFDDYLYDPFTATDDASLRAAVSTLDMALKDPDFVQALKDGPAGRETDEEAAAAAPPPPEMGDEYAERSADEGM